MDKKDRSTLFSAKAKKVSQIISSISILDDGIAFALISHETESPVLLHCEFIPCSANEHLSTLAKLSKQHSLDKHYCNFVLQPAEYQILQVEKPEVADDELASALKWRVKDLIDFHIDDTIIEILTPSSNEKDSNTIEVVAARSSEIEQTVALLRDAEINLASIDISALAIRNIICHIAPELPSYALLSLKNDSARINVYLNNDLYLSRASSIGLNTLEHVSEDNSASLTILDTLALELQRTYDYYESHSRQAPISDLFVLINNHSNTNLAELIQQRTGVNTQNIDHSFLTYNNDEINIDPKCMLTIGAALRKEFD